MSFWKTINGYPEYGISNQGLVRSTQKAVPTLIKKLFRSGRSYVKLCSNKTVKQLQVCYLVASHFVPNPNNFTCVIHLNGDTSNDNALNLGWAENRDNVSSDNWIEIENFPKYEISPLGIRNKTTKKMLTPVTKPGSYPFVSLVTDDGRKNRYIHVEIALHFIPNPENLPVVNHKNGDKRDFTLSNLEWVTISQNARHARENNLTPSGNNGREIEELDDLENVIVTYSSVQETAETIGCSLSTISYNFKNRLSTSNTIIIKGRTLRYKVDESIDDETWRLLNTELPDLNEKYQVSDKGRVRNTITLKVLALCKNGLYKCVSLYGANKHYMQLVHRLVAFAFLDFESREHQVNHKDKNPANNKLENLEILTNTEHSIKDHGKKILGVNIYNNHQIVYNSIACAATDLGAKHQNIHLAVQNNSVSAGHKWSYYEE